MSSTGTTTRSSSGLRVPASTMATSRSDPIPPRNRAMASSGRWVALRPMRWSTGASSPRRRSRRSRLRARCAPRLLPAMAWTSSMITCSTPRRISRAWLVSSRYRLSGVVMRMSGGRRAGSRRSSAGVSPVRLATVICGGSSPRRWAASPMPVSGARRLRSTSYVSALSGDTYRTRTWPACRGPVAGSGRAPGDPGHRKAARVLPLPVGAWMSVCCPALIAAQPAV